MAMLPAMTLRPALLALFRDRTASHSNRVSWIELFFDLIFVFAVTQLSHLLLSHLTPMGTAQTLVLLLAVWWVWMYTSWTTNWLNPEMAPVRVCMFILSGLGLAMSTAIPQAFTGNATALVFAACYVAMQMGRTLFMTLVSSAHSKGHFLNFLRVLVWLALASALWIGGGLLPAQRLALWIGAIFVDYLAPWVMFYVPGLGGSEMADWDVDGEHMAERCGLFIIIALGESIVVMGDSFSHRLHDARAIMAFAVDFITCVALWWLYFGLTAHKGTRAIAGDALPGRLARVAYTYVHILLVAGIIVTAVGAEQVLALGAQPVVLATALTVLGGPALYLTGNAIFIHVINGRIAPLHAAGIAVLVSLIGCIAVGVIPLTVIGCGATAATVLSAISIAEPAMYRWRHGKSAVKPS